MSWMEATPEEVQLARTEVKAFRSAGLEPDPLVVRLAEAPTLEEEPAEEPVIEVVDGGALEPRTDIEMLDSDGKHVLNLRVKNGTVFRSPTSIRFMRLALRWMKASSAEGHSGSGRPKAKYYLVTTDRVGLRRVRHRGGIVALQSPRETDKPSDLGTGAGLR